MYAFDAERFIDKAFGIALPEMVLMELFFRKGNIGHARIGNHHQFLRKRVPVQPYLRLRIAVEYLRVNVAVVDARLHQSRRHAQYSRRHRGIAE